MFTLVTAALAFSGSAAPVRSSRSAVHMSEASNTRRELLARSAVALGGLVTLADRAEAKAGAGAKFSVFGIGSSPDSPVFSEPFEAMDTFIDKQKDALSSKEKYEAFAAKVTEGEKRLSKDVPDYIKKESWMLAKGQMRSMMGTMRKGMLQKNEALPKEKQAKAAKLYKKFVLDIEAVDYACQQKEQGEALKATENALKSLSAWKEYTA